MDNLGTGRLVSVEAAGCELDSAGKLVFKLIVTGLWQECFGSTEVYRRWSELEALRSRLRRECKGAASVAGIEKAILALPVKYKGVTLDDTARLQKRSLQINGVQPLPWRARQSQGLQWHCMRVHVYVCWGCVCMARGGHLHARCRQSSLLPSSGRSSGT